MAQKHIQTQSIVESLELEVGTVRPPKLSDSVKKP